MFALALVLVQALAVQASLFSASPKAGNDIEALCSGKKIDLTTLPQLKELNAAAGATATCDERTKNALNDLVNLIEATKGNVCASESIDKYKEFYGAYLNTRGQTTVFLVELPESLKRFALAYGMQMSNLCKKSMVKELVERANNQLTPDDFQQLEPLIKPDDSPIARALNALSEPNEVILPGDLAPFLKVEASDKIFIQTQTNAQVRTLQSLCRTRFQPVYGPIMEPITRLANMGFNFMDKPLKCDLQCPVNVHEMSKWSRIIFACEALTGIAVVEEDKESSEGTDTRVVRILSKEEAQSIAGTEILDSDSAAQSPIDYHAHDAVSINNDEVIYDNTDKQLVKAVKSFKTNLSEDLIFGNRMMGRFAHTLKNQIKQGNFNVLFGAATKMVRGHKPKSSSESIIRSLDEIIENQSKASLDGAVSQEVVNYTKHKKWLMVLGSLVFIAIIVFVVIAG